MRKSITWAERLNNGYALLDIGYRDYIAARLLLNNDLIVQGLTLASTSVEKYLKSIIVFNLQQKEKYNFHLDRFEELKKLLIKIDKDVTEEFDPVFLDILKNAFRIRYYDRIKEPIFMGFYKNQFIGELDYTIDLIEKFISKTQSGGKSFSQYFTSIKNKDSNLYQNNYILGKENKKDFMERADIGFSIYININSVVHQEKITKGGHHKNKYNGQISKFTAFNEHLF